MRLHVRICVRTYLQYAECVCVRVQVRVRASSGANLQCVHAKLYVIAYMDYNQI